MESLPRKRKDDLILVTRRGKRLLIGPINVERKGSDFKSDTDSASYGLTALFANLPAGSLLDQQAPGKSYRISISERQGYRSISIDIETTYLVSYMYCRLQRINS